MNNKLANWGDTIVAIATAAGPAAIAVIRLSGDRAFEIVHTLFPSKNIKEQKSHTLHVGILINGRNQEPIDEVVVSIFKGPKSYTGEDVIEISCHGSDYVQQQILAACIAEGARLAKPGEFTQRAFLNGKLDLTQAEAVADLIAANTGAAQKTALHNIRGGFSQELKSMREQLIQFASLIELELDFATEDVEFADREKFYTLINQLSERTTQLLRSFQLGNVIKHGVSVAIIGKPNAGKSTLLNTLLQENRAIVSDIAGTTRDTIEENLVIRGILFRLIDTAGIRDHSVDIIENIGMEKSLEKMKTADVVLYIFDHGTESMSDLQKQVDIFKKEGIRYILVANKDDVPTAGRESLPGESIIYISAKNNTGLSSLEETLYQLTVQEAMYEETTIVSNIRHFEALTHFSTALVSIRQGLDSGLSGDLLIPDINNALYHLGTITGEISNEDKLDYIFSKFCIGK